MSSLLDMPTWTWLDPQAFALVPLVLLASWWGGRRGPITVAFAPAVCVEGGLASLPRTLRARLAGLPRALVAGALLLGVAALARPAAQVPVPAGTLGLDIVLGLDLSSSMNETDMAAGATRLDVCREAAARFVRERPDDRIGLLVFARFPELHCPPTRDHDALLRRLAALRPVEADGPEDATGLGTAVARAAQVLSTCAPGSRVVVLLTDGEENVATAQTPEEIAPYEAAQLAESLGVRVYAIAAGEGRRLSDGSWRALDTAPLRRVAERTGGSFFVARDAADVRGVYATIDELEPTRRAEPRLVLEERYAALLGAALACLGLAGVLRAGPLRRLP